MGIDHPVSPSGLVAVPSDRLWFDPALLTANTYPMLRDVSITVTTPVPVAIPNPYRWGIGFVLSGLASTIKFAPWPDVDVFPYLTGTLGSTLPFLTLFNYGPLVSGGWWSVSGSMQSVRVIELLRRT